jgi:hypothetical protein
MVLSKRQKIVNLEYDIFCECFDVMYSGEYNVSDVILSVIHTGQAEKLA